MQIKMILNNNLALLKINSSNKCLILEVKLIKKNNYKMNLFNLKLIILTINNKMDSISIIIISFKIKLMEIKIINKEISKEVSFNNN